MTEGSAAAAGEGSLGSASPVVFISHDGRDAELAEAFSKLLKSVSAGMIRTFRSSDKKGTEGIEFGDEWYKRLMTALDTTSDVVCLFTERSIDRPWILFEAGVAKGKLSRPVIGIALGVSLSRITTGPFYQFHNMDDSEADLTKLVHQLAKRVPGLELDADVVKVQVAAFKQAEADILKKLGAPKAAKETTEETQIAKLVEELKALPTRVAERIGEATEPARRRRYRRIHPRMIDEMVHLAERSGDPVAILMMASLVRDDAPWLYELAVEIYQTAKTGDASAVEKALLRLERFSEAMMRGPWVEDLRNSDMYIMVREFPLILRHILTRITGERRPNLAARKPRPKKAATPAR